MCNPEVDVMAVRRILRAGRDGTVLLAEGADRRWFHWCLLEELITPPVRQTFGETFSLTRAGELELSDIEEETCAT